MHLEIPLYTLIYAVENTALNIASTETALRNTCDKDYTQFWPIGPTNSQVLAVKKIFVNEKLDMDPVFTSCSNFLAF